MIIPQNVFNTFINVLNKYEYCILRNYEILPEVSNDIDILINPLDKENFQIELKKEFSKIGVVFVRRTKYVCDSIYFFDTNSFIILHIDIFTSHVVKFLTFITHEKILFKRLYFNGFFVPSPDFEFIDLLFTRFFYTRAVKKKYIPKILAIYQANSNEIDKIISNIFSEKLSRDVKNFCLTKDVKIIEDNWKYFMKYLIKNNFNNLSNTFILMKNFYLFLVRSLEKIIRPYGLILLLDKKIKSTIYKKIEETISPMFLGIEVFDGDKFSFRHLPLLYRKCIKNSLVIVLITPENNTNFIFNFLITLKLISITLIDEFTLKIKSKYKMIGNNTPAFLNLKDKYFKKDLIEYIVNLFSKNV